LNIVPSPGAEPDIGSFEFHGDSVAVVTNEAGNWAVLSQLSQNLSLDPNGQRQMVERKSWSQGKTCVLHVMLPGQNRPYPQFLIHERIVPMWLANITSSRIGDEGKREKVELAQVELADALHAFVSGRTPSALAAMPSHSQALRAWAAELEAREAAEARVRELEPSAQAWDVLASAAGDYSLRDSAFILNRDPAIDTGQQRLMKLIRALNMVDRNDVPYARHASHLTERAQSYTHPRTQEEVLAKPQIRITVQGLRYLHSKLGGEGPLQLPMREAG